MSRLKIAQRIGLIFLTSLAFILCACDGQKGKGSAKEPVVTKQIGKTGAQVPTKNVAVKGQTGPADTAVAAEQVTAVKVSTPKRMPYNPVGKVDPFSPLYKEEKEKEAKKVVVKPKGPERPRTPLEKLDLAQLKLTAIVSTSDQKRALVEEVSGKGYVVEIGTRIGLERGEVVEIAKDRVIIEHQDEDDFGKTASKKRELKLQKPPGD